MLFYEYTPHEHLYDKMQKGVDIKHLFDDTIDENIWKKNFILINVLDAQQS